MRYRLNLKKTGLFPPRSSVCPPRDPVTGVFSEGGSLDTAEAGSAVCLKSLCSMGCDGLGPGCRVCPALSCVDAGSRPPLGQDSVLCPALGHTPITCPCPAHSTVLKSARGLSLAVWVSPHHTAPGNHPKLPRFQARWAHTPQEQDLGSLGSGPWGADVRVCPGP